MEEEYTKSIKIEQEEKNQILNNIKNNSNLEDKNNYINALTSIDEKLALYFIKLNDLKQIKKEHIKNNNIVEENANIKKNKNIGIEKKSKEKDKEKN